MFRPPAILLTMLALCGIGSLAARARAAHPDPPPREAAAARDKLVQYLHAINRAYLERTKGFTCVTGEEAREGRQVLEHVLASDAQTVVAWLNLALADPLAQPGPLEVPHRWAWVAFQDATMRAVSYPQPDPRCRKALLRHRTMLFDAARRQIRKHKAFDHTLHHFLVRAALWDALPVFMEALEHGVAHRGVRRSLANLTWRNPKKLQWWEIEQLKGEPRKQWCQEFLAWWRANRHATSAQAIFQTARRWELAGLNPTAGRQAHLLVPLLMDKRAQAPVADKDLIAILDADWPRRRHMNENDETAPKEEPIATAYALVRDTAFLILRQRAPAQAIAAMQAGLRRNHRVVGEVRPRYDRRRVKSNAHVYKASLFKPWLAARLRDDIDRPIRDKKLDVPTRFKWLIIRDQFFPQPGVWLYDTCARHDDGTWYCMRDKLGVSRTSVRLTTQQLRQALAERGY